MSYGNDVKFVMQAGGILPTQARRGDAGLDLATIWPETIQPGETGRLETGVLAMELPYWVWGLVHTRSSTRERWGLEVRSSVIDTGYRGPLFIGYKNVSGDEVHIPAGTKLAQLVLMSNVADAMNVQQVMMDKIAESERGTDGFGSTGH